jgi:hypothetical protein
VDFGGIEDLFPSKHGWHTPICVFPIRFTCSRTHCEAFPHQCWWSYPRSHLPQATVDTYCAISLTTSFSQTTALTTCPARVNQFQTLISTIRKHWHVTGSSHCWTMRAQQNASETKNPQPNWGIPRTACHMTLLSSRPPLSARTRSMYSTKLET